MEVEVFMLTGTCLYMIGTDADSLGMGADDLGISFFNLAKGGIDLGAFKV
ncbi:MAG: hypothetical protein AB7G44_00445 [Bacteroidia bacterium]